MAGDWLCSCGSTNFARRDECFRCSAPRCIICASGFDTLCFFAWATAAAAAATPCRHIAYVIAVCTSSACVLHTAAMLSSPHHRCSQWHDSMGSYLCASVQLAGVPGIEAFCAGLRTPRCQPVDGLPSAEAETGATTALHHATASHQAHATQTRRRPARTRRLAPTPTLSAGVGLPALQCLCMYYWHCSPKITTLSSLWPIGNSTAWSWRPP